MKRTVAILIVSLILSLPSPSFAAEAPDFLHFYKQASQVTQFPPPANTLKVLHQQQIAGLSFTLLSTGSPGVFVGTYSKNPIPRIDKYLTLRISITGPKSSRPVPPEPIEWVYLFDRNGDGQFDYLCWPVGPGAVKPANFPADYPKAGSNNKLTSAQFDLFIKNLRFIFWHFADDNFDGRADAAVYSVHDSERPGWIDKWVAFRRTHPAGTYQGWYFTEDIAIPSGNPPATENGYRFIGLSGKDREFGDNDLEQSTKLLGWFNQVAAEDNLPPQ